MLADALRAKFVIVGKGSIAVGSRGSWSHYILSKGSEKDGGSCSTCLVQDPKPWNGIAKLRTGLLT